MLEPGRVGIICTIEIRALGLNRVVSIIWLSWFSLVYVSGKSGLSYFGYNHVRLFSDRQFSDLIVFGVGCFGLDYFFLTGRFR